MMNFLFVAVVIGGIFTWQHTNKEELPDVTFDRIRISVRYPGAPAEDVEFFVTKPIEEQLRGLDGVYRIQSSSSVGEANITVEIEQDYPDFNEALAEIRNGVLDVELPNEVLDDPSIRVFKTSKKAILDVALLHRDYPILDVEGRRTLQQAALALENQLVSLPEVHSVNRSGYLQEELQVKTDPEKLLKYEIPFNTVMRQIRENHVRSPAGALEAEREPRVTLLSELDTPDKLRDLIVQGGFDGQVVRLGDVADVATGYERTTSISKVNGHEAVMFSVVKNSSTGILDALTAVNRLIANFQSNNLKNSPVEIVLLDDESIDVRNRLRIIAINGIIGFVLIVAALFIILNIRAGIWVAMGIPFTFCATMIIASMMGYTINGTTLAAVIIVMGMVVDDAIVVAENITRLMHSGVARMTAVVQGTAFMLMPVLASIVTTCVAFLPLFYFSGHQARIITFIPPVIFLMLGASLVESMFILPGHMLLRVPSLKGLFGRAPRRNAAREERAHWFERVERNYAALLTHLLRHKPLVFLLFAALLGLAIYIGQHRMKFEMFPNEETRDIVLSGMTAPGTDRLATARMVRRIEDAILPYVGREVVGFRTDIAQSRRGGAVEENQFRSLIEIVPKEKRTKSADQLVKEFEHAIAALDGFQKIRFAKSRWGQASGSPIEIIVQQSNDTLRHDAAEQLATAMRALPMLKNVEIDEGLRVPEYRVDINRDVIKRLSIEPADVVSTFRAALQGTVLYEFTNGDEDIRLRLTTTDAAKSDIERVLDLPVENRNDYLVSLRNIVSVRQVESPTTISRLDLKRTTRVFADMAEGARTTPLDIGRDIERDLFPAVLTQHPTTLLSFGGEIRDTRESRSDLKSAVIMVILLIYVILAVLFNSLGKPLIIMLAIPFGLVGVILTFYLHGKLVYGFYAAVGAIGLAGVVVNDAIIMLVKLTHDFDPDTPGLDVNSETARIAGSRLRAVILTTLTTVAGVLPTAYGFAGYDAMLAEMMLALAWGLAFATVITLVLIPAVFALQQECMLKRRAITGRRSS